MQEQFDIIVIGSGIAGLSVALKTAQEKTVLIVTKSYLSESSTDKAQGGIAAVMTDTDSFEKHIQDTLIAGAGLCDEKIVNITVKEAPDRINDLIKMGIRFDRKSDGTFALAKEGAHSENRILHHKDKTGNEIESVLVEHVTANKNITICENVVAVDLIIDAGYCMGVRIFNKITGEFTNCYSTTTILATGGIGQLYETTTNPTVSTGDGMAMAKRAGVPLKNMEFIQFHPTSLYNPAETIENNPSFLISEAVRGFGGILRNKSGEAFMAKYDERKELAPRDIVSRAMVSEMKKDNREYVYLDCTHLNITEFRHEFPTIYSKCINIGIDVEKDFIPVVPCAHYCCGGIETDEYGKTIINNLYAVGECACTGLNGANRLASNSLLEALVFAHRAAISILHNCKPITYQHISTKMLQYKEEKENRKLLQQLQHTMSTNVAMIRSQKSLHQAYSDIMQIKEKIGNYFSIEQQDLRNMIDVAEEIIIQAQNRKISVGTHYIE